MTQGTYFAIKDRLRQVAARHVIIQPETIFKAMEFTAFPMTVPHDAAQPVGYSLLAGGVRMAFVADIGYVSPSMSDAIRDVDFLFLESNHDVDMLDCGPYPPRLRSRVFVNHLSNVRVSEFIKDSMLPQVKRLALGHISGSNNSFQLVYSTAVAALKARALSTELHLCPQPDGSPNVFSF